MSKEYLMHKSLYYEAIIQLRPALMEAEKFLVDKIAERKNAFIAKKVVHKSGGADFYISAGHFALTLGKMLKKRFGAKIKLSKTIVTRDNATSKDVYRVTVCARFPEKEKEEKEENNFD